MSGDEIQVNFGAVSNLASQIGSQVSQIEQELDELKAAITKLAAAWTGGANEAFTQIQTSWNNSAQDLQGVLNRIAAAVQAAHDSYVSTENSNTSAWA